MEYHYNDHNFNWPHYLLRILLLHINIVNCMSVYRRGLILSLDLLNPYRSVTEEIITLPLIHTL
jgi:hypothetical protein